MHQPRPWHPSQQGCRATSSPSEDARRVGGDDEELDIEDLARLAGAPTTFFCSICMDVMRDPVLLPTGQTYERRAIHAWLAGGGRTCPTTGQAVSRDATLIPNMAMRQSIEEWAAVNCPAILDPSTGKVKPSPEALAAEATAAVARAGISPFSSYRIDAGDASRGNSGGSGGRGGRGRSGASTSSHSVGGAGESGGDDGGGGSRGGFAGHTRSTVSSFLWGALDAARSAVGSSRGVVSSPAVDLPAGASLAPAGETPPPPRRHHHRQHRQHRHQHQQHPQPREAGIMYRVGGEDAEQQRAMEEEALRSFRMGRFFARRLPSQSSLGSGNGGSSSIFGSGGGGAGGGFTFFGLFGGGGGVSDRSNGAGDGGGEEFASTQQASRPAARILARYGYNIRITPWVISMYCCMFFYNVVICNHGSMSAPQENPLIGGSKKSMIGNCAYGHNGEHMRLRGEMWRVFTSPWAHGGLVSLTADAVVSFFVVGKLERRLGPYLILFLLFPPLGGVAASAFFLPQQVSTAGCSALASLLGLMAANYALGNQPLQLPPRYEWLVAALGVYISLLGLAPFHDDFSHLFSFLGGAALGFVVLPPEMRAWDKARVYHYQCVAACASVIVVGLPFVWFFAIGDSGCGNGCVSMSCVGGGWWPCDVDHLCGSRGADVSYSVCAATNEAASAASEFAAGRAA